MSDCMGDWRNAGSQGLSSRYLEGYFGPYLCQGHLGSFDVFADFSCHSCCFILMKRFRKVSSDGSHNTGVVEFEHFKSKTSFIWKTYIQCCTILHKEKCHKMVASRLKDGTLAKKYLRGTYVLGQNKIICRSLCAIISRFLFRKLFFLSNFVNLFRLKIYRGSLRQSTP